jgi:hypothetical protein
MEKAFAQLARVRFRAAGLVVRCGEAMSPMACVRPADSLNRVDLLTAGRAIEDQLPELAFQVGFDLQRFEPDLLRGDVTG